MANVKEGAGEVLEWRIRVSSNGSSQILVPSAESRPPATAICKAWFGLQCLIVGLAMRVWRFIVKAWKLGVNDPKKVFHCLKVGVALSFVSLFYYMRPLYEGVGGNAMWAVMTVVVVFEYTVGATLYKCLNRVCGTLLAGSLAIGVHWLASQSGEKFAPIIMGASLFLLASAATFSRFIPVVKARFDYGTMIFILTFSLVSVSGYRVEKLFDIAHHRVSTIVIGTSLCIIISMVVRPVWAGEELYLLTIRNMDKLANSLEGCVAEYFNDTQDTTNSDDDDDTNKKLQGYKCLLNSKATEDTMAGFAQWEPAHGRFKFRHPWKQYLKIGAAMRNCAYCIEALNSCMINSENQAPELIKKHLHDIFLRVSTNCSSVIRELAANIKIMRKPSKLDISIEEMKSAVQELQNNLKFLPLVPPPALEAKTPGNEKRELILPITTTMPLMEVIPIATFASLLIEIAARIEGVADAVEQLANLAGFKDAADDKAKQNPSNKKILPDEREDEKTMNAIQMV